MSLRNIHIAFVTVSTLFFLGVGGMVPPHGGAAADVSGNGMDQRGLRLRDALLRYSIFEKDEIARPLTSVITQ